MSRFHHLFGPVPSRRLGRSLGVDLTPFKTCTLDCVFCQLGHTTHQTLERKEYVPVTAPQIVRDAWTQREGPVVLATVSAAGGIPNVIYATCVGTFGDDRIVIADNYFDKTRQNILAGSRGALLFMTKDGKAYQLKGTLEYHRDGEVFASMKVWNPAKHPGHAAVALRVEEAYSGARKLE